MPGTIAIGRIPLLRGLVVMALGASVAGCTPSGSSEGLTYLPDTTKRLSIAEARENQLRTGTYTDDFPEYTGAPDAHARRPAYVYKTRDTVYREEDTTTVHPSKSADTSVIEVQRRTTAEPFGLLK